MKHIHFLLGASELLVGVLKPTGATPYATPARTALLPAATGGVFQPRTVLRTDGSPTVDLPRWRFWISRSSPTCMTITSFYWRWSYKTNTYGGKRPGFTGSDWTCRDR